MQSLLALPHLALELGHFVELILLKYLFAPRHLILLGACTLLLAIFDFRFDELGMVAPLLFVQSIFDLFQLPQFLLNSLLLKLL